jgi:hypothetical protein
MPSSSRDVIKCLCPQEFPCPLLLPYFPWMTYAPQLSILGDFHSISPNVVRPYTHLHPQPFPGSAFTPLSRHRPLGFSPTSRLLPKCTEDHIF